jgi:bifunctional non-homologous end joining protein LigD
VTRADAVELDGVRLTHPNRMLFPDVPLTKLGLARYYGEIADWIVPHVAGRPLTLVRCPTGLSAPCFFMKHSHVWAPPALRRVNIPEKTKVGQYLIADSLPAVLALVQMNVLEIHTWNARAGRVECPDRLVLDLDPGPEVGFLRVLDAARLVRQVLEALGLVSFVKTTGGRGLHVVVPLVPAADWPMCLAFARGLAEQLAAHDPEAFTTRFAKAGRERKVLIDYLRNNRTNTSIAAFSVRARPGAPVSVPITWRELTARLDPSRFTVQTVPARLARARRDPWADYWNCRQRLTRTLVRAVTRDEPS